MTKRIISLFIGIVSSLIVNCQISDSVLIKGQLISKDKNPISGVSVSVRGLKSGTVSDVCGKIELWVPSESVIDFSMISEPYHISMCDIDPKSDTAEVTFRFDIKQKDEHCTDKLLKYRKIRLDDKNRDKYSQKLIACFKADFEKLTWKYYQYYRETSQDIVFVINGHVMDDDYSPEKILFDKLEQVFVFDNRSNNPNILFIISMTDKGRKERRP
jgi:hypothetical protein